jgi:hypothetical protein
MCFRAAPNGQHDFTVPTPDALPTSPLEAAEESVQERYVYLCLIRLRSSKHSMNSAKSQHPATTIAIDATVQFMSLSSIAVPPHDRSVMVRVGKVFKRGCPRPARSLN